MKPEIATVRQSGRMGVRPIGVGNTGSTLILPEDPSRRYLLLQNNSGADMLIGIGAEPVAGQCLVLGSGVYWEPLCVPTDSIYARSATLTNARGVALFVTAD